MPGTTTETLRRDRRLLVIVYPGGKQQRFERGGVVGFGRGVVVLGKRRFVVLGKRRFVVGGKQQRKQQFVGAVGFVFQRILSLGKQRLVLFAEQ
jgi:hypothetical protein